MRKILSRKENMKKTKMRKILNNKKFIKKGNILNSKPKQEYEKKILEKS